MEVGEGAKVEIIRKLSQDPMKAEQQAPFLSLTIRSPAFQRSLGHLVLDLHMWIFEGEQVG